MDSVTVGGSYMSNYLKNQGTWKLSQLKKLNYKGTVEKIWRRASDRNFKETKDLTVNKEVSIQKKKLVKVKEKDASKKVEKVKKQKARKGISIDKSPQGDSETDKEESVEAMNPTPLDTKSNIVANWKIFQQGKRSIYQIIRANGADTVYMSFGSLA
ncbi:hypothetical protein Tco_1272259 [Tanacetum coccineum]